MIDTLGTAKVIKVDTKDLSSLKDIFVQPGSTIIANSMERIAYIFGDISGSVDYSLEIHYMNYYYLSILVMLMR